MQETVYSCLLKSFMSCLKITAANYAYLIGVPGSTVEDWLSGKCPMPYDRVHDIEERIQVAYARACNFNSAAFKADFENRLEISGFYDKLKAAYDDLREQSENL